jgi:hypothetical protein
MTPIEPILIDPGQSERGWHRLQAALRCPRYYALTYGSDTERAPSAAPALVKGSLVHIGLAHFYQELRGKQDPTQTGHYYNPHDAIAFCALQNQAKFDTLEEGANWSKFTPLAQDVLRRYEEFYGEDKHWTILGIEHELRANVENPETGEKHLYTQRADLIIRDRAGQVWVVDHKTTGRLTSASAGRYTLSGQFLGYQMFGHGLFGEKFGGVILNMIQLPRVKEVWTDDDTIELKYNPKQFKFERQIVEPAPAALARFKDTLLRAEAIIEQYADTPPMEVPGTYTEMTCTHVYGSCSKHSQCQHGIEE